MGVKEHSNLGSEKKISGWKSFALRVTVRRNWIEIRR
jgi:hypothetical protein